MAELHRFTKAEEIRILALDRAAAIHKGTFLFGKFKGDEGDEGDMHSEATRAGDAILAVAQAFERYITGQRESGDG